MLRKILFLQIIFIVSLAYNLCAAIFIYESSDNKVKLTNKIQDDATNKFIENFDKYKLIYGTNEGLAELKNIYSIFYQEQLDNIELKFDREFALASKESQIDFYLLKSIAKVISQFNQDYVDSDRIGLMGVKKNWADTVQQQLTNPEINIKIAAKHLSFLLNKFDYDLRLALAAYYLSEKDVIDEYNKTGDFPRSRRCRDFFNNVIEVYKQYREQAGLTTKINRKVQKDGKIILHNKSVVD